MTTGTPTGPQGAGDPRIELIGQVAGGIAHDFNNLLTVISGYSRTLLDTEQLSPADSEALRRIFAASQKASRLVGQLLYFSVNRRPRLERVELNAEAERVSGELRQLLGESVAVEFQPSPDSPLADADPEMLEQMLTGLAIDARGAAAPCDRISIAVEPGEAGGEAAAGRPAGFAVLTFCATRAGKAVAEPEGRRAGLALEIARDVAKRHGGWVQTEAAREGAGARVRIHLPRAGEGAAAAPAGERAGEARPQDAGRILLVDDDPAVREFAAGVLQQGGYKVLQARSAENALEAWRWHSPRIGLLVADVVLPGELSGPKLAERLRAEKPALRVVFTTGLARDAAQAKGGDAASGPVLQKPYTPRSLLRAVREALA